MNDIDSGLTDLYNKYLSFTDQMAADHNAMEIAAVMMTQALSIYKTILSPEEYDNIVDVMSDRRESVKVFGGSYLQ